MLEASTAHTGPAHGRPIACQRRIPKQIGNALTARRRKSLAQLLGPEEISTGESEDNESDSSELEALKSDQLNRHNRHLELNGRHLLEQTTRGKNKDVTER